MIHATDGEPQAGGLAPREKSSYVVGCGIESEHTDKHTDGEDTGVTLELPDYELADYDVPARGPVTGLARGVLGALARSPQVRGNVYLLLDHSASMSDEGKMEGLVRGALRLFAEARQREYEGGAYRVCGPRRPAFAGVA